MVQRNLSERYHCRPINPLQAVREYCNIQASEMTIRLPSGAVLRSTEAHPEPQEIHNENPLGCRHSRSSVDVVEDQRCHDLARSLAECANSHACEIRYRLCSGAWFEVTGAHPEPREIHNEDPLACRLSRSLVDTVEDCDDAGTASKSGRARSLLGGGRHGRATERKRGASCPISASRKKRRSETEGQAAPKPDDQCEDEDSTEEYIGAETELCQLRIDDLGGYYDKAFRSLSQLCCRDLLKAWIAYCHPKKQTDNPYNGGKDAERSMAEYGEKNQGYLSRPDYWPSDEGIRHKEPDHLLKNERLVVLPHLLQSEGKGYRDGNFCLESLRKSTDGIDRRRGDRWTPAKLERLEEMYRVRRKQMEYEREKIDGDTLVSVQMLKSRCKSRKAPKSAVKAAKASSKSLRKESEEPKQRHSSSVCTAPVAKMYIDVETEDESKDPNEWSEPRNRADTTSSTEEISPDASCPEQTSSKTRTVGHTSPSFDSPGPKDRRHDSALEDWSQTLRSVNIRQDPAVFTLRSPYESVTTHGEVQMSPPLRGQDPLTSSSMQNFPAQVASRQNEYTSTARPQVIRSPPARPIAPKVENVRYPAFTGSSSGLSGVWPAGTGWQLEDHWGSQVESSMFTDVAEPSASFSTSTHGSFSSGYSEATVSGVPQLDNWDGWSQTMMQPHYQSLDENTQRAFGMQAVGTHRHPYQRLGMDTPSGRISNFPTLPLIPPNSRNSSSATEHKFGPFSEHQRHS